MAEDGEDDALGSAVPGPADGVGDDAAEDDGPPRRSRYTPPGSDLFLAATLASPMVLGLTAGLGFGALALIPGREAEETQGVVFLVAFLGAMAASVAGMSVLLVLVPRIRRRYQLEDHLAEVDRKVAQLARIDDRLQDAFDKVEAIEKRASSAAKADAAGRSVSRSLRDILAGEADEELTRHFRGLSAYYDRRARAAQRIAVTAVLVGSSLALLLLLVAPSPDGAVDEWGPNLLLKAGVTVPAGVLFLHFSRLMRRMEYLSSWTALVSVQLSTLYPYGQPLPDERFDALRSQLGAHVFADPRHVLDGGERGAAAVAADAGGEPAA